MKGLSLPDSIGHVSTAVAQRLDTLDKAVPEQREPELPFAEYLTHARVYAAHDPLFRRQFEDALRQYEQVQGVLP